MKEVAFENVCAPCFGIDEKFLQLVFLSLLFNFPGARERLSRNKNEGPALAGPSPCRTTQRTSFYSANPTSRICSK